MIEVAVEPKTKADQEKMGVGAAAPGRRGPIVPRRTRPGDRPDHHQGHGRAAPRDHRRPHEARVQGRGQVGAPQVAYRETITRDRRDRLHPQEADRRLGPVRARQDRASSRCERGSGFEFENKVVGGSVPKEYVPGVEKGLEVAKETGVIAGFPVIDFKASAGRRRLPRGRLSALAFEIAAARLLPRGRCRRPARSCSSRSCGSRW